MKLTRTERLILVNQYRILEALYPEDAEHYQNNREVVESGYELEYRWIAERVYDDEHCLTTDQCHEVYDILQMYDDLRLSYEALPDKIGVDANDIRFWGFDANSESKWLGYCQHVCEGQEKRFAKLDRGDTFNSHIPTLGMYRRMLAVWRPITKRKGLERDGLTLVEILDIVAARPDPDSPKGKLVRAEPTGPVQ